MNEKKKVLIVIALIIAFVGLLIFGMIQTNIERKKMVDRFNQAYDSSSETLLYMGRPGCSACIAFKPILEKVAQTYHLSYIDINTDRLTEAQLHDMVNKIEVDWDTFGTPTIAVVKDKKVIKNNVGLLEEEALIEFLKDSKLISE